MNNWRAHERQAYCKGTGRVVGIDEAGRGPLAGPVVAAACFIPLDLQLDGINDSKKLSAKKREELFAVLTTHPDVEYGICAVSADVIDEINILQATYQAMRQALCALPTPATYALVDGADLVAPGVETEKVIKGDQKSLCIAAASILAKVMRDRMMIELAALFPQYGFEGHKGYGTKKHLEALQLHGPCPQHRKSFAPVAAAEGVNV